MLIWKFIMTSACILALAFMATNVHYVCAQPKYFPMNKTRSMQEDVLIMNCSLTAAAKSFAPQNILQGEEPLGLVGVRGISFSIGYSVLDSIKSAQNSQPADEACMVRTAHVINQFGNPILATTAGAQAAVRGTNFNDKNQQSCPGFGLCANIWDGTERDVYPISTLTYVAVRTVNLESDCSKIRVMYEYINWVLFSSEAQAIASSAGFATMPKKVANLAKSQVLDAMTCGTGDSLRYIKDMSAPVEAMIVKGSGSSLQSALQRSLLDVYGSSGVAIIKYDGSLGSGGGLCELTVGDSNCWFNKTSKETIVCGSWDELKVNCLQAASTARTRTSFAGTDSILEMTSITVIRQGQRMIPVFAAAIGLVYNLPFDRIALSRKVINMIFLGQTVKWNDPFIQATNPGVNLPDTQIIRIVREDKSGTTQTFVRALASFANINQTWDPNTYWNSHPLLGSSLPTWPPAAVAGISDSSCVLRHCSKSVCQVGHYLVPSYDSCKPCAPGTYMDRRNQDTVCKPCPAGHYSDAGGSPLCAKCSEKTYQNLTGQTACVRCPANTRRLLLTRAVGGGNGNTTAGDGSMIFNATAGDDSIIGKSSTAAAVQHYESSATTADDCKCEPGFWLPSSMASSNQSGSTAPVHRRGGAVDMSVDFTAGFLTSHGGEACVPCPNGAECAGFVNNLQTIPMARPGYWGDPAFPTVFYECKSDTHCLGRYYCSLGHMGTMCAEALTGYFSVGHIWYIQCPASTAASAALTVFLTAAVVYLWLLIMNISEGSQYDSFNIGIKFLHLVGSIVQFPLRWHHDLDPVILVLFVSNLEVDFISPHCLWHSFNGVTLFYFQLLVPFVLVVASTLLWASARRCCARRRITLDQALAEPCLNHETIRDGTVDSKDWQTYGFNKVLQVFGFMFQVLVYRSLSCFPCKAHPRGSFLKFFPDVPCGSSTHQAMMAFAVLYLVLVILAMPAVMLRTLLRGRQSNDLLRPEFSQRYGTFYEQFKVEYVWWEMALLCRKFCISAILALIDLPMIQGALAVLLINIFIVAHIMAQPFVERINNVLETVCLFCALAFVCCGMIFYPSLDSNAACIGTSSLGGSTECSDTMSIKRYFSLTLTLLVSATFILSIGCMLFQVRERHLSHQAIRSIESFRRWFGAQDRSDKLRKKTRFAFFSKGWAQFSHTEMSEGSQHTVSRQDSASESQERVGLFSRLASTFSLLSSESDTGSISSLRQRSSWPGFASIVHGPANQTMTRPLQLHLGHLLNGFCLHNWLIKLNEAEKQDERIRQRYNVGNPLSQLEVQELAYLAVDAVLPISVAQHTAALGLCSNSRISATCRTLIEHFPSLIDYMASADNGQRDGFSRFVEDYLDFADVRPVFQGLGVHLGCDNATSDSRGRELVVAYEYRSLVCDWLMKAGPDERLDYSQLMHDIIKSADLPPPPPTSRRKSFLDTFTRFRQSRASIIQVGNDGAGGAVQLPTPITGRLRQTEAASRSFPVAGCGESLSTSADESSPVAASFVELIAPSKPSALATSYVESDRASASKTPLLANPCPTPAMLGMLEPSVEADVIRFPTPRLLLATEATAPAWDIVSTPLRFRRPVPIGLATTGKADLPDSDDDRSKMGGDSPIGGGCYQCVVGGVGSTITCNGCGGCGGSGSCGRFDNGSRIGGTSGGGVWGSLNDNCDSVGNFGRDGASGSGGGGGGGISAGTARFYDVEFVPSVNLRSFALSLSPESTPRPFATTEEQCTRRFDFVAPPQATAAALDSGRKAGDAIDGQGQGVGQV